MILAAFERWGKNCLERFNGMFAFAIWDSKQNELFIARDRLGIKPLYYCLNGSSLIFASEMRALLATGLVKKELDADSLADDLSY